MSATHVSRARPVASRFSVHVAAGATSAFRDSTKAVVTAPSPTAERTLLLGIASRVPDVVADQL